MATPYKLRGKDVLKTLADSDYRTSEAARRLGVTPQAVRDWLKANRCKRVFMCVEARER